MCLSSIPLKTKENGDSEINHFGAFARSAIKAKSASLPFLDWKVCTIAILLNLISIKIMLAAAGKNLFTL